MADQWNENIPALANQILADLPDIEENMGWFQQVLKMLCGWKDSTIGTVGPPNHRSLFAYSDADTITIGAGSYFHDGTTRQTVFWDAAITFDLGSGGSNAGSTDLGASEWHYIYLDDSAIVTQGNSELDADCFLNSTTAPSWSATKHGWYNGADRCIFAVLTNGSNQVTEFFHYGDFVSYADSIQDVTSADIDQTWTDATLTIPAFSTMAKATFAGTYGSDSKTFLWRKNGQTGTTGHYIMTINSANVSEFIQVNVITDTSQKIETKSTVAGNSVIDEYTDGWYLPIGM